MKSLLVFVLLLTAALAGCTPGTWVAIERDVERAEARRKNYTLPPPEPPAEGPPIESVLPPQDADTPGSVATVASPDAARELQTRVDALDLSSCADGHVSGRARLIVGGDGRVKSVTLDDGARLPSDVGACVRLRLRAMDGLATNGQPAKATVAWSTATAKL